MTCHTVYTEVLICLKYIYQFLIAGMHHYSQQSQSLLLLYNHHNSQYFHYYSLEIHLVLLH